MKNTILTAILYGRDEKLEKRNKKIYKEYCKELGIKFGEKDFKSFLEFLEIDFYDWVKENLKAYLRDKK